MSGSSVIVAILLGGVDRCRRFGVLESSGRSWWALRSRGFFVLLIRRFRHLFLLLFSFVSFGRDYATSAPAPIHVWFGWLLCIQSGGKPFFDKVDVTRCIACRCVFLFPFMSDVEETSSVER